VQRCRLDCRGQRMDTLAQFAKDDSVPLADIVHSLKIQQNHKSSAIIKRAHKLLTKLSVQ
jgi:hypothetical protein